MYRPGEMVLWRVAGLHALTRSPGGPSASCEVKGPKVCASRDKHPYPLFYFIFIFLIPFQTPQGDVVFKFNAWEHRVPNNIVQGFTNGSWTIPRGSSGGDYKLSCGAAGLVEAEKLFQVREFRVPKLSIEVELDRKGYAPGDAVKAFVYVRQREGGGSPGAVIIPTLTCDGRAKLLERSRTDANGRTTIRFNLPEKLNSEMVTFSAAAADGGAVETGGTSIPVLLGTPPVVKFFPEGMHISCAASCHILEFNLSALISRTHRWISVERRRIIGFHREQTPVDKKTARDSRQK